MPTSVSPALTRSIVPNTGPEAAAWLAAALGSAPEPDGTAPDPDGATLGVGVGVGVGLGEGDVVAIGDGLGDGVAAWGVEIRAMRTTAKATIINPTSAACESGHVPFPEPMASRGPSTMTGAARATGRRAASAAATTKGSTPGATIEAREARAARNAGQLV